MKFVGLLFEFYIILFVSKICIFSAAPIPENLITTITLSELKNKTIEGESEVFTNENFPSHKFFKIDYSSIKDLTKENHFSFIKISVNVNPETTYKSLYLFVNRTIYNFKE